LRRDLRHADHMHLKVAEHFVRAFRDRMTSDAFRFTKKQDRALFFRNAHGPFFAARETIDGRVGEDQREFKFGDGTAEHCKVDGTAGSDAWECPAEEPAITWRSIEPPQYRLTNRFIS